MSIIISFMLKPGLGGPPTNVRAEQNGFDTVLVSWTAPTSPPSGGYRITATPGSITVNALVSPLNVTNLQPGTEYTIQVMPLSQHYSGAPVQTSVLVDRKKALVEVVHLYTQHFEVCVPPAYSELPPIWASEMRPPQETLSQDDATYHS